MKIRTKKPLRDSPYDNNDIWKREDVLMIVEYESELRNQAIITLLWDLDARNHEITALKLRDIVLNEQYGEGSIPLNTKTGGGPILLTSSFPYVRDWINKHPFKNEPNAKLICNLNNGKSIKPIEYNPIGNCLSCHSKLYWHAFHQGYDQQWNSYQNQESTQGTSINIYGNNSYVNTAQYSGQNQQGPVFNPPNCWGPCDGGPDP